MTVNEKYCPKGNHHLPATLEYFGKWKNGLQGYCKVCTAKYRDENRQKSRNYSKDYDKKHPEVKAKRDAKWISNKKTQSKNLEISHLFGKKICTQCNESKIRIRFARTYLARDGYSDTCLSCGKMNLMNTKIGSNTYSLNYQDWYEILRKYKNSCAYCFKQQEDLSIDHFQPLSKSGKHTYSNIIPACIECNIRKSNNDPYEWIFINFGAPHIMLSYRV